MPRIGDVLSQKYELVRLLGEGGMGAVYEARHTLIGKRLAVKCLHRQFAEDPALVTRFGREAQAAAAIGHRSIIDITDIGMADDGSVFLVMEFLEGRDFGENIRLNQGTLPIELVCYATAQTLSALAAAHEAGIVHRDLKPDNIFLVSTGQALPDIKLLDFGISKMTDGDDPKDRLTKTGAMMGTPFYMAPEQAKGKKDIDHRADIYAVGVIMYEGLTGKVPFDADNTFALAYEILNAEPTPPRNHRPDIPPEVEAVVSKAMSRDVEGRYATAEEMLCAVLPFLTESARDRVTMPAQRSGAAISPMSPPSSSEPLVTPTRGTGPEAGPATAEAGTGNASSAPASGTVMAWHSGAPSDLSASTSRKRLVFGLVATFVTVFFAVAIGLVLSMGIFETASTPAMPPTVEAAQNASTPIESPVSDTAEILEPTLEQTVPEPAAEEVAITLVGVPDGARVFLDDELIEGTILRATPSSITRAVRVELADHQPWRRTVVFTRDTSLPVSLEPSEERAAEREAQPSDEPAASRRSKRRRRDRARAPFDNRFDGRSRPRFGTSFGN